MAKEIIRTGKGILATLKEEDRQIKELQKTLKNDEIIIIGCPSGPKKIKTT